MTQKEMIVDYIKRFGSITPMQAFADLGITKLATRISEIRETNPAAFKIETVTSKNRFGKDVHFARYSFAEGYENGTNQFV